MSLNNQKYNDLIQHYFSGNMSEQAKHELEKEALDNPFLQDALDGFSENPEGLAHFQSNLKYTKKTLYRYLFIGVLSVSTLFVLLFIYRPIEQQDIVQIETNDIKKSIQSDNKTKEIEVIPAKINDLKLIKKTDRIVSKKIISDFSNNQTYQKIESNDSADYILIDPNDIDFEEQEADQFIQKPTKERIFPFVYFYDLAVVDYTRFENRKYIKKTTYELASGLDASFESEDRKNQSELIETTKEISYMEYLKEAIYYFSKEQYKLTLKRLNIISEQYKNDLNSLFYGGLCYYNLQDFNLALSNFNKIIQENNCPFYEEAKWYKVKVLLKSNKIETAKTELMDIISYNGFYKKEALLLLKTIK